MVKLWNLPAGAEGGVSLLASLERPRGWIRSLAFSPDGKSLASGSWDGTVQIWDMASQKVKLSIRGYAGWVSVVAYSPDGDTVAFGSHDGALWLWDSASGNITLLDGHADRITSLAFSSDGRTLGSGSWDETAILWDVAGGSTLAVLPTPDVGEEASGSVLAVALSPDGKTLATGDVLIRLWDISGVLTGGAAPSEPQSSLGLTTDGISSLAFTSDGQVLASAELNGTLRLWDLESADEAATLVGHTDTVWNVAISPDSRTMASASSDSTVRLWDIPAAVSEDVPLAKPTTVLRGHTGSVHALAFSPDSLLLATGAGTGRVEQEDGSILLVADNSIQLWEVATALKAGESGTEPLIRIAGHTDWVSSLAFSPDGTTLVSGSRDGTVRLWAAPAGQ